MSSMIIRGNMTTIQVHKSGTSIRITDINVAWLYPQRDGTFYVKDEYPLTEEWVQEYAKCRCCGKKLDSDRFAWSLWKLQKGICSSECLIDETKKKYACCELAQQFPCVCTYSFICTVHGHSHIGTHD